MCDFVGWAMSGAKLLLLWSVIYYQVTFEQNSWGGQKRLFMKHTMVRLALVYHDNMN